MNDITILLEELQDLEKTLPEDKFDEVRDQLESIIGFIKGQKDD